MPQIAVNATPVKAPVPNTSASGQFSAALSQAAGNTPEASAAPQVMCKSASSGRGSVSAKDNGKNTPKASTASASAAPAATVPAAIPSNDSAVKILNPVALSTFVPSPAEASKAEDNAPTSTQNSSTTTQSDAIASPAGTATQTILSVPAAVAGSVPGEAVKSAPAQTNAPAQKSDVEVAASSLPIPSGVNKAVPELPNAAAKTATEGEKSAAQSAKGVPVNPILAPVPKPAGAEVKPAAHEAAQTAGTADQKTSTASLSTSHQVSASDVPQVPVTALPPIQPLSDKPAASSATPANASSSVKTNSDAVSSSSGTSKKDENAAQNSSSQAQKNDSNPVVAGTGTRQMAAQGQVQMIGTSSSAGTVSSQISQAVGDVKNAPASTTGKAGDAAAKNQVPALVTDAEALADVAASHLASPIQVAKLVERAEQTEMHVGIQAGEFGSVDIRTSMGRSQFTAEISVERGELGRAMSAELPSLHNRLAEQRVPPANIILQNHSYNGNGSSDFRQGARQNPYAGPGQILTAENVESNSAVVAMEAMESSTGLDIHI